MSEATFTFRVDEALKTDFATAAKARDRTGAQLLRDFMRSFVQQQTQAAEHDAWFREQVQTGIDAANAGELQAMIDRQMNHARRLVSSLAPRLPQGAPKAVIVPHAGYVYSGSVAALAYALLERAPHSARRAGRA